MGSSDGLYGGRPNTFDISSPSTICITQLSRFPLWQTKLIIGKYQFPPQFAYPHQQQQHFSPHFALHHPQFQPHCSSFPQSAPLPAQPPLQQAQPRQHPPVTKPEVFPQNAAPVVAPEAPKESVPVAGKRKGGPGGLNKVCSVSSVLQAVVCEPTLPRTEIVKQLWVYIRKNLQDPSNKRKIICDDALRLVFETDCTDMFKMNKLLSKHITAMEPSKESSQAKRAKVEVEPTTEIETTEHGASPVVISDALAKFLGTEGREMLATEAEKRVWEYIKVNNLEFLDSHHRPTTNSTTSIWTKLFHKKRQHSRPPIPTPALKPNEMAFLVSNPGIFKSRL